MRYLWQLLSKRPQDQPHSRIDPNMESEDVARKFLNDKMEATPQDHKGSVSFHNPSAFVNSTTLGGHPSFPTNTPGLQQGHMDNTAPRNPTVRMNRLAAGEVEERSTVSEPQNGPLNLLDLPVDILKDILSQVRNNISILHA